MIRGIGSVEGEATVQRDHIGGSQHLVERTIQGIARFPRQRRIIHHNPLQGIAKAFDAPTVKNQPALKPDELPELASGHPPG